ncbi:MAG: 1-phosphofructokinase family hexose kinase [Planctomycetota bacterium]|jgi:1-phosphofructokinase family hexose kinase
MHEAKIITITLNPAVDRVFEASGFEVGSNTQIKLVAHYPAGKGVNVSRVLGELAMPSIATGFVGRNELTMFEEHLERRGDGRTICQFLIVRARTRDNITIVDPLNETVTHLRDVGFTVTDADVARMHSKVALLARRGTIIAFSGSIPPGLDKHAFAQMIDTCIERGARVVVDTSGEALEAVADKPIWLMKLNQTELSQLVGNAIESGEQLNEAARSISCLAGGPYQHVIVTKKVDGAVLFGANEAISGMVSVHPGRILSTVGCGDALLAGVLAEISRSGDWHKALQHGLATATANAVNQEAGHIEPEDIAEFLAMSFLERLA